MMGWTPPGAHAASVCQALRCRCSKHNPPGGVRHEVYARYCPYRYHRRRPRQGGVSTRLRLTRVQGRPLAPAASRRIHRLLGELPGRPRRHGGLRVSTPLRTLAAVAGASGRPAAAAVRASLSARRNENRCRRLRGLAPIRRSCNGSIEAVGDRRVTPPSNRTNMTEGNPDFVGTNAPAQLSCFTDRLRLSR